ncbi:hypothetical protein E2C01_068242 [Portunus trituberculatus]|uniref:Uncharacterized protein n=1 Tax=Portunus trituberculatus TaxID=210409 RepID=A0A5B7HND3_PORTR|nr:hypothetical protein [Portunus trituberculatus]
MTPSGKRTFRPGSRHIATSSTTPSQEHFRQDTTVLPYSALGGTRKQLGYFKPSPAILGDRSPSQELFMKTKTL